jgi:hypothetical protein
VPITTDGVSSNLDQGEDDHAGQLMVLSLNNSKFGYFVNHIYSTELEIKDIRDTARSASFHDIQLEIDSENRLIMKHHDKKLFQFPHCELSIYM